MAAQHLPRGLVRPKGELKELAQNEGIILSSNELSLTVNYFFAGTSQ